MARLTKAGHVSKADRYERMAKETMDQANRFFQLAASHRRAARPGKVERGDRCAFCGVETHPDESACLDCGKPKGWAQDFPA